MSGLRNNAKCSVSTCSVDTELPAARLQQCHLQRERLHERCGLTAVCPPGTQAIWRDFDWQTEIPDGTSIEFAAQSGDDTATLMPAAPALPVPLAKAIASTDTGPQQGNYDAVRECSAPGADVASWRGAL